ncbi:hypothetical protein KAS41_02260 [Candidatus Parcubacteria bacterium]|nr:hypothetical protein [Candidatus Parcubacteria bacterium]
MKKFLKISGIVLAVIILTVFLFMLWTYFRIQRGDLVKWDNEWYTKEELKEKFPPQHIDVPAKNTPEDVYAKFRQALLDDDIEEALEQIREESRDGYMEVFIDNDKFNNWVKSLPEEIIKEREKGNYAYYDVDYGTEYKNTATFIKDENGYWQIDSI